MAVKDVALRKRQQIAKANRTMFLWVMGASIVVGAAAVTSGFLIQKLAFNGRIISIKNQTVETLKSNNETIVKLKDNVRPLNSNQLLLDARADPDEAPIQVILDALPSEANPAALGASLQEELFRTDDVTVESLSFEAIAGDYSGSDGDSDESSDSEQSSELGEPIAFNFSVSVPSNKVDSLQTLLLRLERSIRAIDVTSLTVEMQGSRIVLNANAVAYYEPPVTLELKEHKEKP